MNYQVAGMSRPAAAPPASIGASIRTNYQGSDADAEPLLATAADIAKMMRISSRTLWRLVSAKRVPEPLRFGGAVRWRVDDIKEWIAAGCPAQLEESNGRRR